LRHLYSSYNLKNVTLKLSFHMVHTWETHVVLFIIP
jgi:hypothetical protein